MKVNVSDLQSSRRCKTPQPVGKLHSPVPLEVRLDRVTRFGQGNASKSDVSFSCAEALRVSTCLAVPFSSAQLPALIHIGAAVSEGLQNAEAEPLANLECEQEIKLYSLSYCFLKVVCYHSIMTDTKDNYTKLEGLQKSIKYARKFN